MPQKPTYEELVSRIKKLEREALNHKQADEKLEEKYKLIAENSADLIYKVNIASEQYTYASPSIEGVLGYTAKEGVSLRIQDILTRESYLKQKERLIKAFENRQNISETIELEAIHKDGHIVPIEIKAGFILDDQGNPAEILGTARDITERKKVENALKESEELYRMIFEHAGFALNLIDAETYERVDFNREAHERLGYSAEEYKYANISSPDAEKTTKQVANHHREIMEKGPQVFEAKHKTKTGDVLDVLVSAVPMRIGEKEYVQALSVDITARKQAEEALRESEERYSQIFNSMTDGLAIIDYEGEIKDVNQAICKIYGYTKEELIGHSVTRLIHPDYHHMFNDFKKQIQETGTFIGETVDVRKDGILIDVEVRGTSVQVKGMPYLLGIIRDISKRKKNEEALRESRVKYQTLYNHSPDMYVSVDAKTACILNCNQKVADELGYTKKEIIGRSAFELYTPESAEYARDNVFPLFKKSGKIDGEELQLQRKDGTVIDVSLKASSLRDKSGAISESISVWRDITKRKRAENEREEAMIELQKALSDVNVLSGLLPMCASCKKIRDDKGYWKQIEQYISDHSEAEFSHGICPDCVKELYPFLKSSE